MPILSTTSIKIVPPLSQVAPATTTQTQESWVAYINSEYHYLVKYPDNAVIQPAEEEERLPVEQSYNIEINMREGRAQIRAWIKVPEKQNVEFPEINRLAALDLKSFAQNLRDKEDDHNPNFPNKKVGELQETTFVGYKAYAVSVTGYSDGAGGNSYRVVYFDGKNTRFVITYSLNGDLSKRIIDTFQFTN